MPIAPADRQTKAALMQALAAIPGGRVATLALLAEFAHAPKAVLVRLLARLSEDERETVPWHRIVESGGAIGWHPHREAQFARLLREGVPVSPAGVVQDMPRYALAAIPAPSSAAPGAPPAAAGPAASPPLSRSRGFKDKPE